jgi:hypothetical protein
VGQFVAILAPHAVPVADVGVLRASSAIPSGYSSGVSAPTVTVAEAARPTDVVSGADWRSTRQR